MFDLKDAKVEINEQIKFLSCWPQMKEYLCSFCDWSTKLFQIEDISALECLKDMKLTQIDLDGNPICGKLDAYNYVTELKNMFPSLQMIVS